MKSVVLGVVAVGLLAAGANASAAYVYDVNLNVGNGSATGTITTDETIGSLVTGNVTDWNLLLNDGSTTFNLFGPLSGNNSQFGLLGASLVASTAAVTFDFSSAGYALFQNPTLGSGINFLCFAGQLCGGSTNAITLRIDANSAIDVAAQRGVQTVATRRAVVPEPGTLALLGFGLAGLGMARRRRGN